MKETNYNGETGDIVATTAEIIRLGYTPAVAVHELVKVNK